MKQKMCKRWLRDFHAFFLSVILAISVAAVLGCSSSDDASIFFDRTVEIEAGDATLTCAVKDDMIACRGIRYAEPPVGNLRFRVPEPRDLEGDIDATKFGSACVQNDKTGSEDCLFLNVFLPKDAEPGDDLPVMVWIHGGALIQGASSVPGYDLPALVKKGVIVVTINYRLNAFGFLPHPALEDATGNFGLKDQALALIWVDHHISAFGGDPGNVTIFGESAGGHSVLSLLVNAPTIPATLFHKAIVQSGSYSPAQTPLTTGYYTLGLPFADLLGFPSGTGAGPCSVAGGCATCTDNAGIRACLRCLTVDEIMDTQLAAPAWSWITPVYAAGTFLPKNIQTALTDGDVADVPVMIGSNLHEGTLFAGLFLEQFGYMGNDTQYRAGVSALINPTGMDPGAEAVAQAAATHYLTVAPGTTNKFRNAYSMIWTDATFTCNNLLQWGQLATAGNDVYAYWFTDADAPINPTYEALRGFLKPIKLLDFGNWAVGASHSFEIQYIFGHLKNHPDATFSQKVLSNRMIDYWTNFAKDGVPGGGWMAYNGANIRKLNPAGDSDAGALEFGAAHQCGFWANPFAVDQ